METITFRLPYSFQEAFLYMDYLITVDRQGSLQIFDWAGYVGSLPRSLSSVHPDEALYNNDQFPNWLSLPSSLDYELPRTLDDYFLFALELDASDLVDLIVYNRVVYFATMDSTWEVPLFINGTLDRIGQMNRRNEVAATQLKAKAGVLLFPCGSEGLRVESAFRWPFQTNGYPDIAYSSDSESMSVNWMKFHVMRFAEDGPASLYENETGHAGILIDGEPSQVVSKFATKETSFRDLIMLDRNNLQSYDGGCSSNEKIYAWEANRLSTWSLAKDGKPGRSKSIEIVCNQIYSGHTFLKGVILDTDVGTVLVNPLTLKSEVISGSENMFTKSFTAAKRYRRLVMSAKSDRIDFTFFK